MRRSRFTAELGVRPGREFAWAGMKSEAIIETGKAGDQGFATADDRGTALPGFGAGSAASD